MASVFISYKHSDSNFEKELCRWIDNHEGLTGWFDDYIIGGEQWEPAIDNQIKQCLCVIVIVTPAALTSPYITYEWSYALGLGRTVIPLLFSPIDPNILHPKLASRQWIDFTDHTDFRWEKLSEALWDLQETESQSPAIENALRTIRGSNTPQEWREAIKALLDDTHPQATKALASEVNNSLPDKSIEVSLALAEKTDYRDEKPVAGLRKALTRKDKTFERAADALGRIGGEEAAINLLSALNAVIHDPIRQQTLVKALGNSKDKSAVPYLHSMLAAPAINVNVQDEIIIALGRLGDATSFPILVKIVDDISYIDAARWHAVEALGKNEHPDVTGELIKIVGKFRQVFADGARQINHEAIEALIAINNDEAATALSQCLENPEFEPWHIMISDFLNSRAQTP